MNSKVFDSLKSVPADRQSDLDFKRAVSILSHMIAARRIWLERFGELPVTSKAMFHADVTLQDVAISWKEIARLWIEFLERIDEVRLAEKFEYKSMDAGRFQNSVEEVLTQLFGHAWYHRGQIAMLVKNCGGEPAITDYIYWCRHPID